VQQTSSIRNQLRRRKRNRLQQLLHVGHQGYPQRRKIPPPGDAYFLRQNNPRSPRTVSEPRRGQLGKDGLAGHPNPPFIGLVGCGGNRREVGRRVKSLARQSSLLERESGRHPLRNRWIGVDPPRPAHTHISAP